MEKLEKVVDSVMRTLMALMMLILVLGTLWQVITRFILKDPSIFTEELLRYILIWSGLLGAAYAFFKDKHLSLGLIKDRAKGKSDMVLTIFIELVTIGFMTCVFIMGGIALANKNAIQLSAILRLPMGLVYSVVPISGCFVVFIKVIKYIKMYKYSKQIKANGGKA